MGNFFSENRTVKILAIVVLISLPIFLSIWFGKLRLGMFGKNVPDASTTTANKITKIYLYCPSIADYCNRGLMQKESGKNLGFGGKVPTDTQILAAFNGQASAGTIILNSKSGKETVNMITLVNAETKTTAIYYFKGEVIPQTGVVKVGTKIATISKNIDTYNTSLLFQLYNGDPANTQLQTLNSNSFLISK